MNKKREEKMDGFSPHDYGLSELCLEIVVRCKIYSCRKGDFNSDCLKIVEERGYLRTDHQDFLRLTDQGKSLYKKLQQCVLNDIAGK